MLQQKQVATVIDYYHRFLAKFPDVESLASAPEEEVLALWAGLGYYRRARQLHAAAKVIVEQHAGVFPTDPADIRALPGIGAYTAGAISSFAYDAREPILEANTIRLFSRLIALREPTQAADSQRKLWDFARSMLPPRAGSGQVNQAVMELGSLLCTVKQPKCLLCPVRELCPTHAQGLTAEIPVAKPKKKWIEETHVLVLLRQEDRWLMRRNASDQWWAGLWDFPRVRLSATSLGSIAERQRLPSAFTRQAAQALEEEFGISCRPTSHFHTLKHAVTNHRITLVCLHAESLKLPEVLSDLKAESDAWRWIPEATLRQALDSFGAPSAESRDVVNEDSGESSLPTERDAAAGLPLTATAQRISQRLLDQA